jgi:type I restriction enzyme S subunit
MEKTFIHSVANLNGVDLSVYKIIRNEQLACKLMSVGRDEKLPVDLYSKQEPSIVSSAYYVFEPRNKEELLPEYLMMWLCRPENDRYIGFISGGDVRGGISWETFCSLPIKVPNITKQREIVKEYNVIQNRIALNQQLIQKLEETAQAIYKQWFVEFEFPNENGKPYKSNGGEMVESELGDIPKGWEVGKLGKLFDVINGYAFSSEDFVETGKYPIIKITNIVSPNIDLLSTQYYSGAIDNRLQKCLVNQDDILISMTGSHMNQINSAVGKIGRYNYEYPALLNQRVGRLKPKISCNEFVFQTMLQEDIQKEILMAATGSANQANISPDTIKGVNIVIPNETILSSYEEIIFKLRQVISNYGKQNRKLSELKELLLSKLATVEN